MFEAWQWDKSSFAIFCISAPKLYRSLVALAMDQADPIDFHIDTCTSEIVSLRSLNDHRWLFDELSNLIYLPFVFH